MHHIYHTEAFILKSRNVREADKVITLYTKEFGLIRATSQGIRKLSSKLRFTLQDYVYCRVDLVRGREVWRVTSATLLDPLISIHQNPELFRIQKSIFLLMSKLIIGEQTNEQLFDDLLRGLQFLNTDQMSLERARAVELCLVLRVLHRLGYVSDIASLANYLTGSFIPEAILSSELPQESIVFEINRAIRESQL